MAMPPYHGSAMGGILEPVHDEDDSLLGQFIPLHYHGQMLADERRMAPFHEAIERLVPDGAHVVDLGGGTGVLSFFAAKRARKVTTVERLPHVAEAARRLLSSNGVAGKVTVVVADAREFMPEEPADVVLCELLHVALVREKQVEVLKSFKARHLAKFNRRIPLIIPEASLLAVQPIFQPYDFLGYHAPVPLFLEPGSLATTTVELGPPKVYAAVEYVQELPEEFCFDELMPIEVTGTLNALRFVTKNVVGIFPEEARSVDWHMQYLSMPLLEPLAVKAGSEVRVTFEYRAGTSVETLRSCVKATLA
ncbi:MAG: methyltransferase domain-containing protein [Polyangiaceae bacterium]|nr:methyltransferase domain-containing protein [Polyangiaceae bacterium]